MNYRKISAAFLMAVMLFISAFVHAQKNVETDVVVVGGGASGTAAALAAAELGARVVILEKQPAAGGTGNFSEGIFAVESSMQRAMNYDLSKDQAFKMIMDYSHWRANAKLVRAYVDKSPDTIDWLIGHGIKFEQLTSNYPGGLYTWHIYEGRGAAVIKKLQAKFVEMGNTIMLETAATGLITDNDGRVVGVKAINADDEEIEIRARAVILATGGFGNNKEMLREYTRFPDVEHIGNIGKTGEGITMAWDVGAAKEGMEVMMSYRPGPKGESTTSHVGAAAKQPHLWLNPRGERFCDESIIFQWPFAGNALENQGGTMFVVFDEGTKNYMQTHGIDLGVGVMVPVTTQLLKFEEDFKRAEANGVAFKASTLEELAKKTGMDPNTLKATVARYNEFYTNRHDADFAKNPRYLQPVQTGPFYAVKSVATSLGTLGGVKVNEKLQAVTEEHKPIPGLYVVGNIAGGMYGDSYDLLMAGSTVGFAMNSGRIAAENAVKIDLGK